MTRSLVASIAHLPQHHRDMMNISPQDVQPIADVLITALQLARPFIATDDQTSLAGLRIWIQNTGLKKLDEALKSAQQAFPNSKSFQAST
jgi:hypothetical protein